MNDDWGDRLTELASAGDMDGLEEAWLEALEDPGPADVFLDALDALDPTQQQERSLSLLTLVLETYEGLERYEDVVKIGRALGKLRPRDPVIRRTLIHNLRASHKDSKWIEHFLRASGLIEGVPIDEGMERFDSFAPYKPGSGVFHDSGWGTGIVEGFNSVTRDLKIRFEDGFVRELPVSSAVESLAPLESGDFRVMLMTNSEGLKAMAEEEPSLLLRKVLSLQRPGEKLTAAQLKERIVDTVIPSGEWQRWWSRAKQAAARDPYLKAEGGSRPVFQLRDEPVSLEEEALSRVSDAEDLPGAVARVREYLAAKPGKDLLNQLLDEVERRVGESMEGGKDLASLMDGVLLLEDRGRNASRSSIEIWREAAGTGTENEGDPARAAKFLRSIATDKGRNLALHTLPEVFPRDWGRLLSEGYGNLPRDLLDPAIDLLVKNGLGGLLLNKFKELMESPWKTPWPIYYLARRYMAGGFEGIDGAPRVAEAALAMLRVLESSLFHTSGDVHARRDVVKRYEELLTDPKRHMLEMFVEEGTREEIARAFSMISLTSKVPESIQEFLRSEIIYRHPEFKKEEEAPFWDEGFILCTLDGIRAKQEELRVITEEKIPQNSKAIGRAAAMGDLSENAEWTAALEDQRLLTDRAAQIEAELENVRAIENQTIPEGIIVPGVRLTYRREGDEKDEAVNILGPWDAVKPGIVSYMAPFAASFLGKKVGDEVTVVLPDKTFNATVKAVDVLDL